MSRSECRFYTLGEVESQATLQGQGETYPDRLLELLVQDIWRGRFQNSELRINLRAVLRERYDEDTQRAAGINLSGSEELVALRPGGSVARAIFTLLEAVESLVAARYRWESVDDSQPKVTLSDPANRKCTASSHTDSEDVLSDPERASYEDLANLPIAEYDRAALAVVRNLSLDRKVLQKWFGRRKIRRPAFLADDVSVPTTISDENKCKQWLVDEMLKNPDEPPYGHTKSSYKEEAKKKFQVSSRAFIRAWDCAIREATAHGWSRPRPKSKS